MFMRTRFKGLAALAVVVLIAGVATPSASASRPTWDVRADFRVFPNQENPSPDQMNNPGVWSYLYSPSGQLNPGAYKLLPGFSTDKFAIPGLESWSGDNVSTSQYDLLPTVGINATGHEVSPSNVHWPADDVLVHPWWNQPVVIGWRSPVHGDVTVSGIVSLAQQPNCGDGVDWALYLDETVLAHGTIAQLEDNTWFLPVHVSPGHSLYLTVSSRTTIYCDSTLVDLNITRGAPE
jgi:hypothetical protein